MMSLHASVAVPRHQPAFVCGILIVIYENGNIAVFARAGNLQLALIANAIKAHCPRYSE